MAFQPNPQRKLVAKEIEKKVKQGSSETQVFGGKRYKLTAIDLPLNYPFYNLENVRTIDDCEMEIKENNLDKDTFSRDKIFDPVSQEKYHHIIFDNYTWLEIEKYREVFQTNAADQRHPIYISSDGIIINGNTRVSYWREESPSFSPIRCLVFEESVPWIDLLYASNNMDSGIDFTQEMSWYQKAKQARNFMNLRMQQTQKPLTTNERNEIAKGCQYGSFSKLEQELTKLEIAEKYLNSGIPGITKFQHIRGDGKYQTQAFGDIRKGLSKTEKKDGILPETVNELIKDSFLMIQTQARGTDFASVHKALEATWSDQNIKLVQERFAGNDKSEDPMQPDDTEPDIAETTETESERKKRLEKAEMLREAEAQKRQARAFATNIEKMAYQLKSNRESLINEQTDLKATKEALEILENEVKITKTELNGK